MDEYAQKIMDSPMTVILMGNPAHGCDYTVGCNTKVYGIDHLDVHKEFVRILNDFGFVWEETNGSFYIQPNDLIEYILFIYRDGSKFLYDLKKIINSSRNFFAQKSKNTEEEHEREQLRKLKAKYE